MPYKRACIGLACCMMLLATAASCRAERYTAQALLMIKSKPPVVQSSAEKPLNESEFQIYKRTQGQLVLSRFVLQAALRKPDMVRIPDIERELKHGDPIRWLKKNIKVEYPGDAEIMEISCTCSKPQDARTIAAAVADAYLTEVVNVERERACKRITELETVLAGMEQELRTRRAELMELARPAKDAAGKSVASPETVDIQMLRFDIQNREQAICELSLEYTRAKTELRAPTRVEMLGPVELPIASD